MNKETVHLDMSVNEADKVAHVLMAALHKVSMLDSERVTAHEAANNLFSQLKYGYTCGPTGNRIESV